MLDDKTRGSFITGSSYGYPDQEWVTRRLEHISATKVVLVPFMLIPGNHSAYEIEGDNPDSWKKVFEDRGYDVSVSGKVLADSKELSGLLVSSLHQLGKSHGFL